MDEAAVGDDESAKSRLCEHCGEKLRSPRAQQRFCNGRCRNAAWRDAHPRRKRSPRKPRVPFELRFLLESIIEF
jgi:hypothetical protein